MDFLEENFELVFVQEVIENTQSETDGAYMSAGTYPDQELMDQVGYTLVSESLELKDALQLFGGYLAGVFVQRCPKFFEHSGTIELLKTVDSVIHKEVKKLYSAAELPKFWYEQPSEDELILNYSSKPKMCFLAEGVIAAAAAVYKEDIQVSQSQCMHDGADHCTFQLSKNEFSRFGPVNL